MELEAFLHGLGVTRKNRYFEDCLQEARIALHDLKKDATPAYQRQAVKWAVYNFLNKQLSEDYKVFKIRTRERGTTPEDRVIRRIARRSEYRELTNEFTPFERMVYVLSVSTPLDQAQIADTLEVSERSIRRTLAVAQKKVERLERKLQRRRRAQVQPVPDGAGGEASAEARPKRRRRKKARRRTATAKGRPPREGKREGNIGNKRLMPKPRKPNKPRKGIGEVP